MNKLALVQDAEQNFERGRPELARELATQAARQARNDGDKAQLGWALMVLGRAEMRLDRPLPAHAAAAEACALLEACADVPRLLWALNTCASVHLTCGETTRSVELYRKGLALPRKPGSAAARCALLINLSGRLFDAAEYAEALRCSGDAAAEAQQPPQLPGQWIDAQSRLASMHIAYADVLQRQGRHDDAQTQRRAGAAALPPLDPRGWRSFSNSESYALWSQTEALAALARWPQARQAAAAVLWSGRGKGPVTRGNGFVVLAELHRCGGRVQRAIHYEKKVLALWRGIDDALGVAESLKRLARLHAQVQAYGPAVACSAELRVQHHRQHTEAQALRCRLAALERQADRRNYEANEARVHSQRLVVLARLIAQTHHALSSPITQVHDLSKQLLGMPLGSGRAHLLQELALHIERAGNLVSQLKLFSYRSTPHPMALSLHDALLSAWRGLAQHVGPRLVEIDIVEDVALPAWADAQRLGIVLKLLLIELIQTPDTAQVHAHICAAGEDAVLLRVHARSAHANATHGAATLGANLCMEIAIEMGGSLRTVLAKNTGRRYLLQLPAARAPVQA